MSAGKTATPPAAMQRSNALACAVAAPALRRRRDSCPPLPRPPPRARCPRGPPGPSTSAKPCASKQRRDSRCLARADLDREQAADGKAAAAAGTSRRMTSRPSPPANSAPGGSCARDLRRKRAAVALGDVRRVGEDRVALPRAREQVAFDERDLETERRGVRARDLQRVRADVGAHDVEVRALVLERERDRAAAGPDVHDPRALARSPVRPRRAARSPAAARARADRRAGRCAESPCFRGCTRPARAAPTAAAPHLETLAPPARRPRAPDR